jgi:TRAP-type mannitol/chloroaromatic compound transport system permease large subunit
MFIVMLLMFLLGFVLDFIEITFVVVPIVGPILLAMGIDPVWLGIMIAINLQTSFLTPPFGFALFYLRGVAPASVETTDIYRGVVPFVVIQLLALVLLALWPELATWLPEVVYGR